MKKLSLLLILILAVSMIPGAAWAGEASPWTKNEGYTQKMFGKLDFGVKNILLGATHIISDPLHGINEEGAVGGLNGLGKGLYHSVAYIGGGALHAVTFPITNLDVPLPEGGAKCPCCDKTK